MSFSDYIVVRREVNFLKKVIIALNHTNLNHQIDFFFHSMTVQIFYSFIIIKRKVGF